VGLVLLGLVLLIAGLVVLVHVGIERMVRGPWGRVLRAIREDLDLTAHLQSAIDSLRVVIAADQSAIEGRTIDL
jgi:ABC-type branched-subunit amino acid transport system permease subunit